MPCRRCRARSPAARACSSAAGSSSPAAQETPQVTVALGTLWSIDLARAVRGGDATWREHPSWPGPPRILPVIGARDGRIYLVSGAELVPREPANEGREPAAVVAVGRRFLADAYAFDPVSETWREVAPPPVPLAAAPSPAIAVGSSELAFVSGDDGVNFARQRELADRHPGFSRSTYLYDTTTDTWRAAGEVPPSVAGRAIEPVVATPAVAWRGRTVIPSGETRPGVRTSAVLLLAPKP
jgi:N-acetylneuraminic acid mutarotase